MGKPAWANRCTFIPMKGKVIHGFNFNWRYETFYEAELKCHKEKSGNKKCTGIYQKAPGELFEVRMGKIWYDDKHNPEGQSWACLGYLPNRKMVTDPNDHSFHID